MQHFITITIEGEIYCTHWDQIRKLNLITGVKFRFIYRYNIYDLAHCNGLEHLQ